MATPRSRRCLLLFHSIVSSSLLLRLTASSIASSSAAPFSVSSASTVCGRNKKEDGDVRPFATNVTAFFLKNGVLEPLNVVAESVRSIFADNDGMVETLAAAKYEVIVTATAPTPAATHLLHRGWSWMPRQSAVEHFVALLQRSCFAAPASDSSDRGALACARALLLDGTAGEGAGARARATLEAYLVETLLPDGASASCAPSAKTRDGPETGAGKEWTIFSRPARAPHNMHFDAVDAERGADCAAPALGPRARGGQHVRVWLPLAEVTDAPLLLAETTHLYEDACPKRAPAAAAAAEVSSGSFMEINTNGGEQLSKSPTWRIYSRDDFLSDCRAKREQNYGTNEGGGTCSFRHTLGMIPGEALFFRNGMVMHGSANHGNGRRITLAMDCVTFAPDDDAR